MRGLFLITGEDLALVLVKMSLYASIDLIEASMLGRRSVDAEDHFVGEVDSGRSIFDRVSSEGCPIKEGFLLKTFRDGLLLSSGASLSEGPFIFDLPNPNLEAVPARGAVGSEGCPLSNEGSRVLERGWTRWFCCAFPATSCPLRESVSPVSLYSGLRLLDPGCAYAPGILLPFLSPGRVGGSNPNWYAAIVFCYLRIAPEYVNGARRYRQRASSVLTPQDMASPRNPW